MCCTTKYKCERIKNQDHFPKILKNSIYYIQTILYTLQKQWK